MESVGLSFSYASSINAFKRCLSTTRLLRGLIHTTGLRGNAHRSPYAHWKARSGLPIRVN